MAASGLLVLACACSTAPVAVQESSPPATARPTDALRGPPPKAKAVPAPATATRAHVTRVVDGDTVVLTGIAVGKIDGRTGGRHARIIGVDTPEVYGGIDCFGREASAFAKRELDGADVDVSFDVDPVDRYGRALVYIWKTDGTFFNGALVSEGYALQFTVPPNVRYAELFTALARDARASGRGLWSRCR